MIALVPVGKCKIDIEFSGSFFLFILQVTTSKIIPSQYGSTKQTHSSISFLWF